MTPVRQPTPSTLTLVPPSSSDTNTSSLAPYKQPQERHITVTPRSLPKGRGYVNVPQIMLRGLYLEKMGFTIGSKVTVIENPGEIIVRLDGPSAHRDPNETADDRRQARKVKRVADYQQSTQLPLRDDVISQYLSGDMDYPMQKLLSRLIDGEVPEPYQASVSQFLNAKRKPATDNMMCDSILWEMDQLPTPKRKRAIQKTTSPGDTIQSIQKNTTRPIPQAPAVESNFILPPASLQVAEPPQHQEPTTTSNHILNVLRTMKCPSSPPPCDPAASPLVREHFESTGPRANPQTHYAEIPSTLRMYFIADELEIHDACRPDNGLKKADQ